MEFAKTVLAGIASQLGVSFDELSADFNGTKITPRVLALAASHDRRKVKRGVRLYYDMNRGHVSHSYLYFRVQEQRRGQLAFALRSMDLLGAPECKRKERK